MARRIAYGLICFLLVSFAGIAEELPVRMNIHAEENAVQPGRSFWVTLRFDLEDSWHAYWKNPGDAGMGPSVEWTLPEGFEVSELYWPTPEKFEHEGAVTYGYENGMLLLAEIKAPATIASSEPVVLEAEARWVVCSGENCLPGQSKASVSLPVAQTAPEKNRDHEATFGKARANLPKSLDSHSAKREGDRIALHLPALSVGEIKGASFYPADSEMIDAAEPVAILQSDEGVQLHMKGQGFSSSHLEGVAVLAANDGSTHSFEIRTPIVDAASSQEEYGLGMILVLAFVGGMILNLMPCVLPVISFKVMSFVNMAGQKRSETIKHGLAFAFGVLLSFWALAGALLVLQAYGRAVGWGFQLQEPIFVAFLAAFLLIFGLSLFGVFELGTSVASMAGKAQVQGGKSEGLGSSFMSGILATAVATPCTGPFLGTAVGFAVTQPPFWAMTIFTSLGLGMALPYILLGVFPSLLRFMPKPGNWMITFKELMGFVMVATVLWLVWVFGAQTGSLAVSMLLAGFFLLSIASWIYGKWGSPIQKKKTRMIGSAAAALFFLSGSYVIWNASEMEPMPSDLIAMADISEAGVERWEPFDQQRLEALRAEGVPVFVDFTARWCLICQTNHMVLNSDDVTRKMADRGVVKMIADWTKHDDSITEFLAKFGRNGVPLYLLYLPGQDSPEILPQVLTPGSVREALEKIEHAAH